MYRIGLGSDIHKFASKDSDKKLFLGGVEIPKGPPLEGHSDADVVLHAIGDALLGAAALGDLGEHFPSDAKNKDRSSVEILHQICRMVWDKGHKIVNVDVVIMAEEPKISPHRVDMIKKIAAVMNVNKNQVGVKATTCEGLGAVGRREGIFAQAVVLLEKRKI